MNTATLPQQLEDRIRSRNDAPTASGPVLYWMQRDQRVQDNWAFTYAQQMAKERGVGLVVVFSVVSPWGELTRRQYDFMLRGLAEVADECTALNIPFRLLTGEPADMIPAFVDEHDIGEVVVDFNPLRLEDQWRADVASALSVRLTEVDAHNIVPCWVASGKQEFAAHTFRPKITKLYRTYGGAIPAPEIHPHSVPALSHPAKIDWSAAIAAASPDDTVPAIEWCTPGAAAATSVLQEFVQERLETYADKRNDPNESVVSNLSPYLHFGQISAQRIAHEIMAATDVNRESRDAFFEELVVRRELTDNFCFYNPDYDKLTGAHEWAQKTLAEHRDDEREHIYTKTEFETAKTHDPLWNAAQMQMVQEGKMHGFMRMYWAKKILEWTNTPEYAIEVALYLNDRYELDGSDPNGVVGVMWSIAGVHDRAWTERPVFGKIRYMNYNGCKRKFAVDTYIDRYTPVDPDLFSHA